jgi:outer membrane lipoprotein-sorting protein
VKAFIISAALVLTFVIGPSLLIAQTMTVDQVLKKMEQVSAATPNLQASIQRTKFTAVTGTSLDPQIGKIWVSQSGSSPRQIKVDFTKPVREITLISNGLALHYYPGEKTGDSKPLNKDDQAEGECVIFGLCQPGPRIKQYYDMSIVGQETVDGIKATRLKLKPKDPTHPSGITSIELWLDAATWYTVQTRITESNKNTTTSKFSNFQTAKIPNSEFKLDLPRDAQIDKHK